MQASEVWVMRGAGRHCPLPLAEGSCCPILTRVFQTVRLVLEVHINWIRLPSGSPVVLGQENCFDELIQAVQIGSKDGALPPYGGTSPPSALRTGQATPRGIRLASEGLAPFARRCVHA